nr:MAG TPA: hypothetical protein [Caudoviricetes sp.]
MHSLRLSPFLLRARRYFLIPCTSSSTSKSLYLFSSSSSLRVLFNSWLIL